MTCKHSYIDKQGHMQCEIKNTMQLMKCLQGGIACYEPREGVKKKK